MTKQYPTQERLLELLEYRDGSLYWKVLSPHCHRLKVGDRAGSTLNSGYRSVYVDGKPYVEHVLIFILHHGYRPEIVDHINGEVSDNRIENLRPCTLTENLQNSQKPRRGVKPSSRFKGVSWHKAVRKWTAVIRVKTKLIHLGCFDLEEDAAMVYNDAAVEYFGAFSRLNEA